MKKIFAVILAVLMLVSCTAFADDVLEFVNEGSKGTNSFVEDWAGEYVLTAYYVGEDFADENDVEAGIFEIESDATLTVEASLDASATGSDAGVMVDQAAYFHAHVYDMDAVLTYGDEEVVLKCPWDGWVFSVPGEGECDYDSSVGKLSKNLKGDVFMEILGMEENEAFEEALKYVGMTTDGNIIICFSESNLCKKGNDAEIGYALIFSPVEAE